MRKRLNLTTVFWLALAALACGDEDGSRDGDRSGLLDDAGREPPEGDGGGNGGNGTGNGGGSSGGGNLPADACELVDMIIAVDGSSSMSEELAAMRAQVFPAFAERLKTVGKGLRNFRVAAMDACPNPATYHTRGKKKECNFSSGQVWMDSTSPDLRGEFACVGDLNQDDVQCSGNNDDEQPASAAAASLEAPFATGPNSGFSRPDALLVILAITDEDEQPTGRARTAQEVYERIVATKGDVRRVVFIGIGGGSNCEGVYGGANAAVKLRGVTGKFIEQNRGVWHDLCVGRLEDSLDEAFKVIDRACTDLPIVI